MEMKRYAILLLSLTLLGGLGMVCAHRVVGASADAVEVRETVLSGDRAAAEGVEMFFPTECRMWLYWDTTLRVGTENETQTDFRLSGEEWQRWYWEPPMPLTLGVSDNIGGELLPEPEHELYAPVSDVASRVAPGESGSESVRLRDFF